MTYTRRHIQAEHIPAGYRWQLHVVALALSCGAFATGAIALLHEVRATDLLALAAAFLVANGGEYALHRFPFHHKLGSGLTYYRHTTMHHAFFAHDSMAMDEWRDLKWVLLPAWGFVVIVAVVAPVLVALALLRTNLACFFLLGIAGYYAAYELMHTASHLPSRVAGAGFAAVLTRHHRLHHDPRLMQTHNFNFAFPLFDWFCRSKH